MTPTPPISQPPRRPFPSRPSLPAIPPVEVEPPERDAPPREGSSRVTLKGPGGLEVALTGVKTIYMALIVASIWGIAHVTPPLLEGMRDMTAALREAADEARAAHAGVRRLEAAQGERDRQIADLLKQIAADVAELRRAPAPKR